jgi:hypothetical protein
VPVLAAGGSFAVCALIGLLGGIFAAQHTGQQLWVLGGLFAGIGVGGYCAVRLLMRSM